MLKIFDYFKKKETVEKGLKRVELTKIDKHINLILRERLGNNNKTISDNAERFEEIKPQLIQKLKELSKKPLMNPNIPKREIQIMDGNRDNYVKNISHFVSNSELPKSYLDLYNYTIKFSEKMESLSRDVQKNTFILQSFFENEMKDINKNLSDLEESVIKIRVLFEKQNIQKLQKVLEDIDKIKKNLIKINNLKSNITEHDVMLKEYEDKISKLKERINTITTGTDYRALESFKTDKERIDEEIKKSFSQLDSQLSEIDIALKKYYYKNPDKKIIRAYMEEPYKTILSDDKLEIAEIVKDIREHLEDIELKDKKRELTANALSILEYNFIKEKQAELKKLEDQKQHLQTKITHNSASLNLSEQQYWINANQDKINKHKDEISRLDGEIIKTINNNVQFKEQIKECLEIIYRENIILVDDLEI